MTDAELRRRIETTSWTRSGLLLTPATSEPPHHAVLDYLWAQIEWHELGEERATLIDVLRGLQELPAANWLARAASISAAFLVHGAVTSQDNLFRVWSDTETGRRAQRVVGLSDQGDRQRALVTPRHLAGLSKLALVHAPLRTGPPIDDPAEIFLRTYLQLCDVIADADRTARTDGDPADDDPVRNVLRFYVQEGEYGEGGGAAEPLTRIDLLLRRIPAERGERPLPAETFEAAHSLPLDRYLSIGGGVLAYAAAMGKEDPAYSGDPFLLDPAALFRLTNVTDAELDRFYALTTLTPDDIGAIRSEVPTSAAFYNDYERVRRRPLCRLSLRGAPRLIPVSLPFLAWRVTEGVYWDVADAHRDTAPDEGAGEQAMNGFMRSFGASLERHLERLFSRALPPGNGLARRVYADVRTQGKRSKSEPQLDLVFPYDDAFVVIEVKSARFHYRRSVVAGDLAYIEGADLDKLFYRPVRQLDKAVGYLQRGAFAFGGRRYDGEPIYPVLVTYGAPLSMWPAWPTLLAEVERRGLLTDGRVRPLAALQVGEAEILAALAYRGHAVRDVVRRYVEGDRPDVSFRNFAHATYADDADVIPLLAPDLDATLARSREMFRQ